MMTISIDSKNSQKAKIAIQADSYLITRMELKEGYKNVWIVNAELIRNKGEGLKFVMTFIECMTNGGVPRNAYSFGGPSHQEKNHLRI